MEGHKVSLHFLQDLVSQTEPDVTVLSFKVNAGAGRGDNYTSMLYRVSVSGMRATDSGPCDWQQSLIIKRLPDNQARRELYRSDVLFQNEVSFYKEALPSLLEFQQSTGANNPFNAVPKCFLAEKDVIVLEDLKERGFMMSNRKETLTYEHSLAIFREIARFHALSLAMKCQDPVGFQDRVASRVQETIYGQQDEEYFREYYITVTRNALASVSSGLQEEERSNYLRKFEEFLNEKTFFKTMTGLVEPKEPLAVLSHGDFWTNNMMFRYSPSGAVEEVCFVDFQIVRYCSPALDLLNLLYSCTTLEFRAAHLQDMLAEYCSALRASLSSMGCALGTLPFCNLDSLPLMIEEEIQAHRLFGLGLALDMIPILTCDPDLAPDLYETEAGSQESVTPFGSEYNPECKRRMTELVKDLVDQGYL